MDATWMLFAPLMKLHHKVQDGSTVGIFLPSQKQGPSWDEYLNTCTNNKSEEQLYSDAFFYLFQNS